MDHMETHGNRQTAYLSQSPAVKLCSWEQNYGEMDFVVENTGLKKNLGVMLEW